MKQYNEGIKKIGGDLITKDIHDNEYYNKHTPILP